MDEQLSWEKFATTWGSFLGQADLIVNGGMFSTGLTVSFEQLVIDNEIFSYIKRLSRGILVDEDTLALDIIERVGPKGDYLGEEHTLHHLKSGEHWEPLISTREIYENWQRDERDIRELAESRQEGYRGESPRKGTVDIEEPHGRRTLRQQQGRYSGHHQRLRRIILDAFTLKTYPPVYVISFKGGSYTCYRVS
jgi:hypothetical protein